MFISEENISDKDVSAPTHSVIRLLNPSRPLVTIISLHYKQCTAWKLTTAIHIHTVQKCTQPTNQSTNRSTVGNTFHSTLCLGYHTYTVRYILQFWAHLTISCSFSWTSPPWAHSRRLGNSLTNCFMPLSWTHPIPSGLRGIVHPSSSLGPVLYRRNSLVSCARCLNGIYVGRNIAYISISGTSLTDQTLIPSNCRE